MSLRTQAVNFLRDNPFQEDKTHFSEFLTADGETWYDYLNRMGREGEWGDNIMLRGLADVLGRKICIISTFGEIHNQTTVEPSEKQKSDQSEDVFLGHIDDQHYVSLRKSDWRETWYKSKDIIIIILYGSAAEGLATSLDYRILSNAVNKAPLKAKQNKVFHAAMILPEDDVVEKIDLQSARANFQIEMHYDECNSGYVRLHSENLAKRFPDRVKPVGDNVYLSNGNYRGSRGLVTAFKCEDWPTFIISDWMDRERPSGWPNGDLMEEILAQFLTIAPFAHPQSSDPDIEWQFCFVKQEFLLAMSLNDNQKYCFHVLQVLLRFHVGDHILKRYYLKNIFFHALENIHIDLWNSNPGACVMYLIDRVIDSLITRNLPHYFVPGNNLLCVLSEESCNTLSTKLQAIRRFPITSIILVAEAYNLNTSWIADRVIEDIPNFKRSHDILFDVYIPSYITEIQKQIVSGAFRDAAKTFMDAFQEISKGSIFSILSLRDFLHETVHGILSPIQWWFCFFLDFFHKTKSLCQMFGSIPGVHLCHLLDTPDDAGVFWCIKIPFPLLQELSRSQIQGPPFHLSIQIAFLYVLIIELNKQQLHEHSVFYSRILIQKRKEHISECSKEENGSSATDTANGSGSHEETAAKKINLWNERMVNILQVYLCDDYIYLFKTYQILGEPEMFTEHVEDLESVCDIISTSSAYKELANIWLVLGFKEKHREAMDKSSNLVSSED
ncbi:hypothetical protein FSP39_006059 [Pinctada imbricata]|uniref:Ubiquitinyl hydrolase 1 n=1 Tax=Pinctada imbricata TaxID=66713 RepID=A0AA88YTL2_PINIB|nr:hypothetical protein FSP39_006059 [Pinctada imbricata]